MSAVTASHASSDESVALRIRELESKLADALRERDQLAREKDKLRRAYDALLIELERLRRRIFFARAERVDAHQLELEFAEKRRQLEKLTELLAGATDVEVHPSRDEESPPPASTSADADAEKPGAAGKSK